VWPLATQATPGLSEQHRVTVELRETFQTPAPAELRTTAELVDSSGKGEFLIGNVPFGEYVLVIQRLGYLVRCMNVTISDSDPDVIELAPPDTDHTDNEAGVFNLWYGDINDDLSIDDDDLLNFWDHFNVSVYDPEYDPACDLDANGRIDNSDALLCMHFCGYYAGDYPGAENVDFLSGQSIISSNVKLALSQGYEYRVPIIARNIGSFAGMVVTVRYDPDALALKTAAEQVFGKFASPGKIPGTGITITAASPGVIELSCDSSVQKGEMGSTLLTVLKFEALRNGAATVFIE
jgi:hypothetical protein